MCDVMRGMPLLTNLSLAMRTDPLAVIRGVSDAVMTIYGPEVTFAFPDAKVEAYRRLVAHETHFSSGREYTQSVRKNVLRELISEDLLFAKTAEPDIKAVSFNDHFLDRMGKKDRRHTEMFPKLWKLRPYDRTNGEITRLPCLIVPYQKMRKETEDWCDYKKLPEEIPQFPLIRWMLLGEDSVVQTEEYRVQSLRSTEPSRPRREGWQRSLNR